MSRIYYGALSYLLAGCLAGVGLPYLASCGVYLPVLTRVCSWLFEPVFMFLFGMW